MEEEAGHIAGEDGGKGHEWHNDEECHSLLVNRRHSCPAVGQNKVLLGSPEAVTHQIDGHGQHAVAFIVNVLPNQIHAPWGAGEELRRGAVALHKSRLDPFIPLSGAVGACKAGITHAWYADSRKRAVKRGRWPMVDHASNQ